jgi:hypothetical protein
LSESIPQRLTDDECESISAEYRWPGNRLSYLDMRRLTYVSNNTKRPINQIIKEAVAAYTTMMIGEIEQQAKENTSPSNS